MEKKPITVDLNVPVMVIHALFCFYMMYLVLYATFTKTTLQSVTVFWVIMIVAVNEIRDLITEYKKHKEEKKTE